MTTIDTHPDSAVAADEPSASGQVLAHAASLVTSSDHKRIGRLFLYLSLLLGTGLIGLGAVLGFDRIQTGDTFINVNALGQLFSLWRVGLVFMLAIPCMLGVAISVVPLQIGARSLAFPRLAALGLWTWLTGSGIVIVSYLQNGGPGGGKESAVDLFLAGLGLTVIGLLCAAISLATTVLTSRAPGMTLERVPAFAWSALVTAASLILVLPVLLAALIYLFADHRFGARTAIDVNGWGGNEIYPWIRTALSGTSTLVWALPVLGFVAEVVPTFARRRNILRAGVLLGVGIVATASLTGVTQVSHGIGPWSALSGGDRFKDMVDYAFFTLLPVVGLLAVMGAVTLTLLVGLKARTLRLEAPLLFGLGAVAILTLGIAAHLLEPIADLQLSGTVYEEGVFFAIVYSVVIAALGSISYWGPKMRGRRIPKIPQMLLALGATGAAALVVVPNLIAGFNNQPGLFGVRNASELVEGWTNEAAPEFLNVLTSVGHVLMALTILGFLALAVQAFVTGKFVGDDPWDGQTLEWATSSPPPVNNFVELPIVSSAEPLADLKSAGSDA
ncbi:MAG: hypothetical protein F2873_07875 [Actinobacteria bacterium]|uniref:Unannotated protein n=1 Tax=freshwater metagenome TaxID=449393 RepID=A0A6J7NZF8_9ZZZZ|nr:hypothetical protein [Actinomycetota bacterium]